MNMKRFIALLLVLCLGLSLAACGKSEDSAADDRQAETGEPGFVYTASYKGLDSLTDEWISVRGFTKDGFYATCTEKVGENIPEGVTPRYADEYAVYETYLYFVDFDGKMSRVENYKALPAETDTEGRNDFSSSTSVAGMKFRDDGFVSMELVYSSWNESGAEKYSDNYWQGQKYIQKYYLRHFDLEGNELSMASIEVAEDEWLEAYRMQLDTEGNALVSTAGGIRAIAPDGSNAYFIPYEGYVESMFTTADGSVGITAWNDAQGSYMLHMLDAASGSIDEGQKLGFDAYSVVTGSGEYDFYYNNGMNFYGYKAGNEEGEKLFNWIACDVNGSNLNIIGVDEEGSVTGLISEWDEVSQTNSYELVKVKKVPADSVPKKETLTLACVYIDYNVQDMIVRFNRSNKDYRIEIKDYSEDADGDWQAGATKLNTEIMSGNVPDLFCLNGLNYQQLAAKGVLEDLYPYMDNDPELERSDFFPNVLSAFEVGGKLCSTVSGIYINSVLGAASVVGDTPGWTYDEFNEALASMPEGCTAFDEYVTRDNILQSCLALDMDSFVDWSSGQCNFNSQQFISLLEFAKGFPSEFDWENYNWEAAGSTEDRLAEGRQMLMQASAYSIDDIFYNNYTMFMGADVTYIGYPCLSGTGNMLSQSESGYAMSSKSEHKEAAWQLLRQFFTEEYQSRYLYSLPSRIDVFEAKAEEATTVRYQTDEDGNQILDENGEPIPIIRYNMWNQETDSVENIYALTEEQVDEIRQLILSTDKLADYNEEILNIVTQQAAPYFEGHKSAEDVAKLIQSKVNIYVNEQR